MKTDKPTRPKNIPQLKSAPSSETAFAAFKQLENQRQTEWLFRRHRSQRPAWTKD